MRTALLATFTLTAMFGQTPQDLAAELLFAQAAATAGGEAQVKAQLETERAAAKLRAIGRAGNEYSRGTRSIDRRDYEAAIQSFDAVIEARNPRADGAMYWKAYSQHKLGRRDQALATLAQLQKEHPQSRWLSDAKALEVEVRQAAGKPVSPESESDDDLKLLALNSLMQSDPERSIPVIEKVLKDPKAAPKVKERALFVLAQSRDERARAAVASVAKGSGNPDLQMKAVEYLGVFGKGNAALLQEIYNSSPDLTVRRAVVRGYMMARDSDRLLAVARSEQNPDLRREAIQMLGTMRDDNVSAALASLYNAGLDQTARRAILDAMMMQGNAKGLIEIARKETDPKLRQQAVERLSVMKSKEAADFMMEVLSK